MRIKALFVLGVSLMGLSLISLYQKSSNAYASSDGGLASTSTGTSDVQLIVQELVQVENLVDIDFDNGDGSNVYVPNGGDVSGTNVFCVYYNNATGVDLTLSSTRGAGSGFVLEDGSANAIPYIVEIDEGNDGGFTPHADSATVNYPNMADLQPNCAGGTTNALRVRVNDTGSPLGVPNGTYTDTITYLIAPNP
ncbi:MAG: hypothetical protein CMF61_01460 [Magnetococcales bacterium]|nr:hypothetical protein [Magnetococcales bacterium]